jgi:hypothetical protein
VLDTRGDGGGGDTYDCAGRADECCCRHYATQSVTSERLWYA